MARREMPKEKPAGTSCLQAELKEIALLALCHSLLELVMSTPRASRARSKVVAGFVARINVEVLPSGGLPSGPMHPMHVVGPVVTREQTAKGMISGTRTAVLASL